MRPVVPATYGKPPDSLIVACVYVGDKYPLDYVDRLYGSVKRNLTVPFTFHALTDNVVHFHGSRFKIWGGRAHAIRVAYPGWWAKIGLFDPQLFKPGQRVLYLDLDVVVCGSLDRIVSVAEPFVAVENFSPNRNQSAHNSSVMVWTAGHERPTSIFNDFRREYMDQLHGDQCWISRLLPDTPNFSNADIKSYKYHTLRGDKGGSVIVFHGKPDPHEVDHPLVVEHWKS